MFPISFGIGPVIRKFCFNWSSHKLTRRPNSIGIEPARNKIQMLKVQFSHQVTMTCDLEEETCS